MDLSDAPATLLSLSRLLDQCLELDADSIEPWLAGLPQQHQHLLPRLREMVSRHRSAAHGEFLATCPACPADQEQPAAVAGAVVGPYVLLRQIGRGGMSTVWLAEHREHPRRVAIKLHRRPHAAGAAEQVAREGEITAMMADPRVARLLGSGVDIKLGAYLVLEPVDGVPLAIGATAPQKALRSRLQLFVQMARAVAHVHARGVVHRDLKPSNFLVAADGAVHLIDFGIAMRLDGATGGGSSTTERSLTPAYASPEQARGQTTNFGSDVYSLGVMLCELLTGQRPGPTGHGDGAGPIRRSLPTRRHGALDSVVAKALSPASQERYAEASELADAVQGLLQDMARSALSATWVRSVVQTTSRQCCARQPDQAAGRDCRNARRSEIASISAWTAAS